MVHILKMSNVPLNIEEDDIKKLVLKYEYVKEEKIEEIKIKTKEKKKTNEIKRSAYIYCDEVSKMFKIGSNKFTYKSNEYEISYYKEK